VHPLWKAVLFVELGIRRGDNDTSYPVTVWAIATAKN